MFSQFFPSSPQIFDLPHFTKNKLFIAKEKEENSAPTSPPSNNVLPRAFSIVIASQTALMVKEKTEKHIIQWNRAWRQESSGSSEFSTIIIALATGMKCTFKAQLLHQLNEDKSN